MINGLTRVTTKRLSYDQQTVFPSFKNRKEGLVIKKSNPEEKSTLGTKRDLKKVCTSRKPICSKL